MLSFYIVRGTSRKDLRQGGDVGTQYRSAIYYTSQAQKDAAETTRKAYEKALGEAGKGPITTEIREAGPFYFAEGYHQQYLAKNPQGYCGIGGTGVTWDDDLELCHLGPLSELEPEDDACPGVMRDDTCWVADGWAGCVMERAHTPHELTDATPAVAPFRPYYWPSWEGANGQRSARYNSYLPGDIDESVRTNGFSNDGLGPNLGCPQNAIAPFTDDREALVDEIDAFEAWHRGGTMGHIGMLWGWRMLSPAWDATWGTAHWEGVSDEAPLEQIVVFMTDGANGYYTGRAPGGDSDYTAYGRMSDDPDFSRSNQRSVLNERMESVCESMRATGVEIFTVGFALSDSQANALLGDCASSEAHVFASEVSTLVAHFEAIARDIYERRVALVD